jgi:hypothetical protein
MACPYSTKRTYLTREEARAGADSIRAVVTARGGHYNTLYPYRCPGDEHWHLSSSRQGVKSCPTCGQRQPAWFDKRDQVWVVYAHGDCLTQPVGKTFGQCHRHGRVELVASIGSDDPDIPDQCIHCVDECEAATW